MKKDALLGDMVSRLTRSLGDRLVSVVLYGPAVHGDTYVGMGQLNLLIVLADLEPDTLRLLGAPVHWWLGKGEPWPRFFTEALLRDSIDVYPIELADIRRHHRVLHGADPVTKLRVDRGHLRIQCERELREKLMRLREGYVEARGSARALRVLLAASFASFAPVWRGCLHLLDEDVPKHDADAAEALCRRLGLDHGPFAAVARLALGEPGGDVDDVYARYQRELDAMVARVDRLVIDLARERAERGETS